MNNPENEKLEDQIRFLGLKHLGENWDQILSEAKKHKPSYHRFLSDLIGRECFEKRERKRQSRIKRAHIAEPLLMETFPFDRQPQLKKRFVMELYDSLDYMSKSQDMVFVGPTGCGKTGLSTSYLIHAMNQGYSGYFIDFADLLDSLYRSVADHTEKKVVRRFASYDILCIDEMGYTPVKKEQAGLFFNLMRKRHRRKTTLISEFPARMFVLSVMA